MSAWYPMPKSKIPYKGDNDLTKLTLGDHDVFILIRKDMTTEVYCKIDKYIGESQLLGLGIGWCLENEEWRKKIAKRAHKKVSDIIAENEATPQGE